MDIIRRLANSALREIELDGITSLTRKFPALNCDLIFLKKYAVFLSLSGIHKLTLC